MECGVEFIRPASRFMHLLFEINTRIIINYIILIFFSKMCYLKTDSGLVNYGGYKDNLQIPQFRYSLNLTLSQHYADNI